LGLLKGQRFLGDDEPSFLILREFYVVSEAPESKRQLQRFFVPCLEWGDDHDRNLKRGNHALCRARFGLAMDNASVWYRRNDLPLIVLKIVIILSTTSDNHFFLPQNLNKFIISRSVASLSNNRAVQKNQKSLGPLKLDQTESEQVVLKGANPVLNSNLSKPMGTDPAPGSSYCIAHPPIRTKSILYK